MFVFFYIPSFYFCILIREGNYPLFTIKYFINSSLNQKKILIKFYKLWSTELFRINLNLYIFKIGKNILKYKIEMLAIEFEYLF